MPPALRSRGTSWRKAARVSRSSAAMIPARHVLRAVIGFNRRRCAATTLTFPSGAAAPDGFLLSGCPSGFTSREFFPNFLTMIPARRGWFLFA
jgi:hypothetical protein